MTLLLLLVACMDPIAALNPPAEDTPKPLSGEEAQAPVLPTELPAWHNPRIPLLGRRPSEAERGEATIWIRGEVPGLKSGQVRFHAANGEKLKVICLGEVADGRYEAEAPPFSPDPVYVSVVALGDEEAVDAPHVWGALEAPLTLAGKDLVADLALGATASWAVRTEPSIDRIVTLDQVKSEP